MDCIDDTLIYNTNNDWLELWGVGVVVLVQVYDTNKCQLAIELPGGTHISDTDFNEGDSREYTEGDYNYVVSVDNISVFQSGTKVAEVEVCREEIFIPSGTLSLDKTSYEQGEQVIVNWADVNFTGGTLDINDSNGLLKKRLIVNAPVGTLRYTLLDDAQLGTWFVFLDYENQGIDYKEFNVTEKAAPEFCMQYFRIEDQNGTPLLGAITSPDWDTDLQVPNTGEASLYMEQGITHTITVYNYEYNLQQTLTFTTCTVSSVIFVLDIPEDCRQYFKVVNSENNPVTDITIRIPGKFSLSVDENGELSYTLVKDEIHDIEIIQHHDPIGILIYSSTFTVCSINPLIIEVEKEVGPEIGKIGVITYDIIKQILNDEIVFYIPVTNLSDKELCFYVDLYDESSEFVDKAPNTLTPIGKFANKIAAGATEVIEMNSNWELWHIGDVQGQVVTFKLKSDEPIIDIANIVVCSDIHTTYDVVDEVTLDLNNIDIAINTRVDNTEGLITKSMEVGLLYVDPTTLTKTDVCNSPIDITGDLNTEIVTGWFYPAPFTCSDKVYPADSMFVAYVKGSDDEDNEYYEISSIFRSVYGIKEVTLKVTSDSVVDDDGCYIWSPVDPTKCLITDNQAKFLMYGGIIVVSLYGLHVFKPVIHGAGEMLKELKK